MTAHRLAALTALSGVALIVAQTHWTARTALVAVVLAWTARRLREI